MKQWNRFVPIWAIVAVFFALSGCSLSTDEAASPVAGRDDSGSEGSLVSQQDPQTADSSNGPGGAGAESSQALAELYRSYLVLANDYRMGRSDGASLDEVAAGEAVDEVRLWRENNDALVADGDLSARVDRRDEANIEGVLQTGDNYFLISDCTLVIETTAADIEVQFYQDREVSVQRVEGSYKVTGIDRINDGLASGQPTCIPEPVADRAETAALNFLDLTRTARSDPSQGIPDSAEVAIEDPLRSTLAGSLEAMSAASISSKGQEEYSAEAIGIDPGAVGEVAIVGTCVTYPNGRTATNGEGEETVVGGLGPGSSVYAELLIRLDGEKPTVYDTRNEIVGC